VVVQLLLTVLIGFAAFTATVLAVLVSRFLFPRSAQKPELSLAWVAGLSAERYKPMLRLLDEQDFVFLRSQPGFTEPMAKRLREHRYRMFMAYLESLRGDFEGLVAAVKTLLAQADHDRPNLAFRLLRAQFSFGCSFLIATARAWLWHRGYGKVDARQLVRLFQGIQFELQSLRPGLASA
jgi:hypothetical protein